MTTATDADERARAAFDGSPDQWQIASRAGRLAQVSGDRRETGNLTELKDHVDSTAKRRRRPANPLRACSPRSAKVIPEPATRSRTVAETSTSPGDAVAATRAAV